MFLLTRYLPIYLGSVVIFLLASLYCHAKDLSKELPPEAASGLTQKVTAVGEKMMAVTANKYATQVAMSVLEQGGSALDAAIAAQMMLGLVEPQSSGIGGGAFLLYWDNKQKTIHSYDGRETAPQALAENHFLDNDLQPMNFFDAVIGGHAVGVPGVLKMLDLAHQEHGKLPWARLFKETITLATNGFPVSARLHELLKSTPIEYAEVATNPDIKNYFYLQDGNPVPTGHLLKNLSYAKTLQTISAKGVDAFYDGEISQHIVERLQNDPHHKSLMTLDDLKNYRAIKRDAVCGAYLIYKVCGAAPPTSGGITVLAILGMINQYDLTNYAVNSAPLIHLFAETSKLAFADRNKYIADPAFVNVPTQALIDADYLAQRAQQIELNKTIEAKPGAVKLFGDRINWGVSNSPELPSTSHLSIVDQWGNAVSMTTSIETAFGSRVMVDGFLLNNQLTDFAFTPRENNEYIANRVQGGKRPRSSMSPIIVLNPNNSLRLIVGSPGGARIIDYTAKTIIYYLAKDLSLTEAVAAPNIVDRNDNVLELETGYFNQELIDSLTKLGHTVKVTNHTSGINTISFEHGKIYGVADPRREGLAAGI